MGEVETVIREHIAKEFLTGMSGMVLNDESSLFQSGIIDSLAIFLLVAFVEQRFGIKLQEADLVVRNFESVTRIAGLVTSKLSART